MNKSTWRYIGVLAIVLSACASPGPTGRSSAEAGADAARRAEDYAWRCELMTNLSRLACLDQLPWRVPGYFGARVDPFKAPAPRR